MASRLVAVIEKDGGDHLLHLCLLESYMEHILNLP